MPEKLSSEETNDKSIVLPRDSVTATATGEFITEMTLPKVTLSEAYAKICRIKVGDKLPALTLADAEGKPAPLEAQFGTKLTVVAFIRLADPYAGELLDDLERFIVPVFEPSGVKVLAVAIAEPPDSVAEAAKKKNIRLTLLSDADNQVLKQLSTDDRHRGPWTYLVDPTGQVLWFDAEYSRTTRRDLQVALQVLTRTERPAR